MGIEPTLPAWKAGVLPLNYTRTFYIFGAEGGSRTHTVSRTILSRVRLPVPPLRHSAHGRDSGI